MDGVIARNPTKPVVLVVRGTELRACHAGCFGHKLESDNDTGWWHCPRCGEEVVPLPELTSSGLWPGSSIVIPSAERTAAMGINFTNWIAEWLGVAAETVEVSIEWG
jgi:hypothetical protein